MWPGMKLVHGKPRHSRSQWSVERSMFETCLLLGCPTTSRKPGLKDYALSKARKTELCIQASLQALMRLRLEQRRGSNLGILRSLKTYPSIETEKVMEQLFNAGMNNGRDKEDKKEANQQDRKDEDENQTNNTSEETVEKKYNKNFTVWFVRRSHQALTSVQCVTSLFMLFVRHILAYPDSAICFSQTHLY